PVSVEDLLAAAPTLSGIYRTHLQSYFTILRQHPDLINVFSQVVAADSPIQINSEAVYKLGGMGLIKLTGNKVVPSCELYRLHFRDYLAV
ncbi:MAG: AAA-like domain-containing protein, partial [Cyanobacteria bacterium J06600_6]